MLSKNTVCIWYEREALEAARFYARTFPGSEVGEVMYAPGDYPAGKAGEILTVSFTVLGIPCMGLNGGPGVPQTEAFSFHVSTEDQEETDRLWDAIVGNGGREIECSWCADKWGVRWQIAPRVLTQTLLGADRAAAKRVFEAMLQMKKIDVAAIEAARSG